MVTLCHTCSSDHRCLIVLIIQGMKITEESKVRARDSDKNGAEHYAEASILTYLHISLQLPHLSHNYEDLDHYVSNGEVSSRVRYNEYCQEELESLQSSNFSEEWNLHKEDYHLQIGCNLIIFTFRSEA